MTPHNSEYMIFSILGLHPRLFGESYAITTATEHAVGEYNIEHFVLTQRPKPSLLDKTFDINVTNIPAELGTFNIAFASGEAFTQAKIEVGNLLEARATELSRPDLAYLSFELSNKCASLVGPWVRGLFNTEIRQIAHTTQCPKLKAYLSLLVQNAPFVAP